MFNLQNHQSKIKYLLAALALVLVILIVAVAYQTRKEMAKEETNIETAQTDQEPQPENEIQKQIKELDQLRSDQIQEKSPDEQLKELDKLRK